MADFCSECSIKLFEEDFRDFAGIVKQDEKLAQVLCEGCGIIWVDKNGKKVPEKLDK